MPSCLHSRFRRWYNGSFFATVYALFNFARILTDANHNPLHKAALTLQVPPPPHLHTPPSAHTHTICSPFPSAAPPSAADASLSLLHSPPVHSPLTVRSLTPPHPLPPSSCSTSTRQSSHGCSQLCSSSVHNPWCKSRPRPRGLASSSFSSSHWFWWGSSSQGSGIRWVYG
jgi:hypothetical protein